jgi:hypothetical protein
MAKSGKRWSESLWHCNCESPRRDARGTPGHVRDVLRSKRVHITQVTQPQFLTTALVFEE